MNTPTPSPARPLTDLGPPLGASNGQLYHGARKGWIETVSVGAQLRVRPEVYDYHVRNGFGPTVPPYSEARRNGAVDNSETAV
jgi:hypothetical protein